MECVPSSPTKEQDKEDTFVGLELGLNLDKGVVLCLISLQERVLSAYGCRKIG